MAQQNQTSVQIVVDVKNRQQLEQLKKTVNELAKSTNQGSLDLGEYVEKIKEVVKSSGSSISTLKAQINLWEKIRTNVSGSSDAYAVASSEIKKLNTELQKISRTYVHVTDVANKASRAIGSVSASTARYLNTPASINRNVERTVQSVVAGQGAPNLTPSSMTRSYLGLPGGTQAPTVQEVIARQGAANLTPSAATRAYLGRPAPVDTAAVQAQQRLTDLAREQFGITGLSQNLQRQKTKLAQDEAAANASTVEYMRAQNRERMSAMRSQALSDIGGRLAPNVGGPLALPAYTERGLQQLTGGLNLAPGALELSRARRATRVAQLRLQRQRGEATTQQLESLGLGVGFPAMFGAGAGSILGSAAGSFIGQGFAGQIAGGAIGQIFDRIAQSARDFAKSLREGGDAAGFLEQQLGYLDPTTKNYISNLQKSGQTQAAASEAIRQLSAVIGKENAEALRRQGERVENTDKTFKKLLLTLQAVSARFEEFRYKSESFQKLFGDTGPTQDALTQVAKNQVAAQKDQNALLEAQGKASRYILGTNSQQYSITQKQVALSEKIVAYNEIIRQQKAGEISKELKILRVREINLEYQKRITEIDRQVQEENQRDSERAAREAKQAADERLRLQKRQADAYLEYLQIGDQVQQIEREIADYSRTELQNAKQRVTELKAIEQRELAIFDQKYQAAMIEAKINGTVRETAAIYGRQQELLIRQQQQRRLQRQEAELQLRLEQQINQVQNRGQRFERRIGFASEIAGMRGGLATSPEARLGYEQEQLRLEQARRFYQEISLPEAQLVEKRAALEEAIQQGNKNYADTLRTQINQEQALVNISRNQLTTVFQLQQQQLIANEHARQFGGIYDAIGGSMTNTFDLLIQGSENWGASLQNIAATVLQDIARQLLRIFVIEQSIGFMRRIFTPAAPATDVVASFNQGVAQYGFAMGGIMSAGGPLKLKRYAGGGIATSPQMAIYGEGSRPEAYVPLPDGRTIPVTMKGGGGMGNVTVNVDANGTNVQGDGQQANALGKAIGIAVQQELIKQKRPGGLLA
jgi:hypothetical protein